MANLEYVEILKLRVEVWNEWRKNNGDILPNFINAYLSFERLHRIDLTHANLTAIDLTGADPFQANLWGADLGGSNLYMTNFTGARLN